MSCGIEYVLQNSGLIAPCRSLAMACSVFAFARPARLKWKQAGWLTLASLPITEAGLGLIQVSHLYPNTIADIAPLLAGILIISELLGPIVTHLALVKSGEGVPA